MPLLALQTDSLTGEGSSDAVQGSIISVDFGKVGAVGCFTGVNVTRAELAAPHVTMEYSM